MVEMGFESLRSEWWKYKQNSWNRNEINGTIRNNMDFGVSNFL